MGTRKKIQVAAALLVIAGNLWQSAWAGPVAVKGLRVWNSPDSTRFVFDVDQAVEHNVFTLANPDRVVIDFRNVRLATRLTKADLGGTIVKKIRRGKVDEHDLRVVLDLTGPASPKSILLRPNTQYGYRVVVDLDFSPQTTPVVTAAAPSAVPSTPKLASPPAKPATETAAVPASAPRSTPVIAKKASEKVIAIDAGHGGEDPGARGPAGTREKDVVLSIAHQLAKLIDNEPGMRAVLVRQGDYYIPLRKRMQIARQHEADLFISIHADAVRKRDARGASVYTLSEHGATSEAARWLADSENAADLVGGVSLDDKDDMLASVLLDLAQTATTDASENAAKRVLGELKQIGALHHVDVQRAAFAVLKSPDVPSMLVESAFISNPDEERRLRQPAYQRQLADAIFSGVVRFFTGGGPKSNQVVRADVQHVVKRGDTLGSIARRYQVSVGDLRLANKLQNDVIIPGKKIVIPLAGNPAYNAKNSKDSQTDT